MPNPDTQTSSGGLFTSCPECSKQFRIQAAQLSMASGIVKCGMCGHQFNALSRLSDAPLIPERLKADEADSDTVTDPDTGNDGVGTDTAEAITSDEASSDLSEPEFEVPSGKIEIAAIFRAAEIEEDEPEEDEQDEQIQEDQVQDEAQVETDAVPLLSDLPDALEDELPDDIREEIPVERSLLATVCWSLGTFLLLTVIVAQLAWFNRDQLLLRYPHLNPVAKAVCERLHCEVLRHKDVKAIKLLNRDVRNHPLFAGNLLVNATMANQSETIQPFPLIQLALFDNVGEVIGYREFKPEEYLDDSINIPAGMMPKSPIHFVLEVSGPVKEAVSFEFHFL